MEHLKETARYSIDKALKQFVENVNRRFNSLSLQRQKQMAGVVGAIIAAICLIILLNGIANPSASLLSREQIIQPTILPMPFNQHEKLIPMGKMKGEMDGEFDAFYIARDSSGSIYINRNWDYENMFEKSPDWKPITKHEFEQYKKQLSLLPPGNRRVKR